MLKSKRTVTASLLSLLLTGQMGLMVGDVFAQSARIVHANKPGSSSRVISPEQATALAKVLFSAADVKFMQGMIMHHAQALDMTDLVAERSENPELIKLAERIEVSQRDEIKTMQNWLSERGFAEQMDHASHSEHAVLMPGMLTAAEIQQLKEARTNGFDKLFLEFMIKHHYGALLMVDELMTTDGAAQESVMFTFATDIEADQKMEIERMAEMLAKLSPDPRVGLAAGYLDAASVAQHVELLQSLSRPEGFYSPHNPAGAPAPEEPDEPKVEPVDTDNMSESERQQHEEQEERKKQRKQSKQDGKDNEADAALWNFANTDMAFTQDTLVVGNYHGFNIYNIAKPEAPVLISSVVCPGGQGDVSIVDNLLIMSVEQNRGRIDCGLEGVVEAVSDERMRGIRIFDISDLALPQQVAVVQTCRGSHTHTVVSEPDEQGVFYVYVSGLAGVRDDAELAGCSDAPQDPNTALFSIDVVEISTQEPQKAKLVNQPRIFADPDTGSVAGLWKGGDHGRNTQYTNITDHCHDITVFPELNIAAGACSGNGILMDISDPLNPVRLDAVADKGFAYWHSATFNNDGSKVIFTDEWGGGTQPRCRASDPDYWGANAIFDIVDNELVFRSYYKLPAPQSENENCVAHNGSLVPIPGRDIMVQAWYQGGLSMFDFTDSSKPYEIAYFDRGPLHDDALILAGYWSVYWHKGLLYGSEIARGLDVIKPLPSEFVSATELQAAQTIDPLIVNAQYQRKFTWPAHPAVAMTYAERLYQAKVIDKALFMHIAQVMNTVEARMDNIASDTQLTKQINGLVTELQSGASDNEVSRVNQVALQGSLTEMASLFD